MAPAPEDVLLVAAAGTVAATLNALAGGGTLVSFPALLATGTDAVTANITSSVGLIPGYAGGSVAYRRELSGQRARVRALGVASVLGGIAGALLLLATPGASFRAVVPYLILLACLLLAAQNRLAAWVATRRATRPPAHAEITLGVQVGVFLSAIYGSYFGAGLGVMLLGVLGTLLDDDLQRLNALKGVLSLVINAVGVVVFVSSARVAWVYAAVLAVSAYVGGTAGVAVARRLPVSVLRACVIVLGVSVSVVLLVTS